jgi:hypothetical protein
VHPSQECLVEVKMFLCPGLVPGTDKGFCGIGGLFRDKSDHSLFGPDGTEGPANNRSCDALGIKRRADRAGEIIDDGELLQSPSKTTVFLLQLEYR